MKAKGNNLILESFRLIHRLCRQDNRRFWHKRVEKESEDGSDNIEENESYTIS